MQQHSLLLKLPHEVLLSIFREHLDIFDLWCLTQVSKDVRSIALLMLRKQWKVSSKSLFKTQMHASMVAVAQVADRLIKRIMIYDPYAFPPFLTIPHQYQQEWSYLNIQDTVYDLSVPLHSLPTRSITDTSPPSPSNTFPPTIEPDLDEGNDYGFVLERYKYHAKRLHHILQLESGLHHRIVQGVVDENMRTVIDIVFHHAVFVSGRNMTISTRPTSNITATSRAFASAATRLLCSLMTNSNNDVAAILLENIETWTTFTEYRLIIRPEDTSVLNTITAFLDFLCACYVAYIIPDNEAIPVVRRICGLTSREYKRQAMMNLVDVWLSADRPMVNSQLARLIQQELE